MPTPILSCRTNQQLETKLLRYLSILLESMFWEAKGQIIL